MQPSPETRIAPQPWFQLHGILFWKQKPRSPGSYNWELQLGRWLLFLMSLLKGNKKEDVFILLLERKQRAVPWAPLSFFPLIFFFSPNIYLFGCARSCCCSLATESYPTLCNAIDCSPPGSFVHGISQARILEWVAFPSAGHLPNPGIEPGSPELQADSSPSEPSGKPMLGLSCNI